MHALAQRIDGLLTRRSVTVGAAIIVVVGLVAAVLNVVLGHSPRTLVGTTLAPDYLAHWTGGRFLLDGRTDVLYDNQLQHDFQVPVTGGAPEVSWFVGPPIAAMLFAPFALLPYVGSVIAWSVFSVALLVASMVLLRPMLPRLGGPLYPVVVLAVAATQPVLETVGVGQDSALSLALWVAGLRLLRAGRDGWAGAVLALGMVKPQLFVLVPLVLLAQRRWRGLACWCASASGLLVLSLVVVGPDVLRDWVTMLRADRYQDVIQSGQSWMMQGVPSLLAAISPTQLAGPAQAVGYLISAALVAALVLVAWRAPHAVLPVWTLACLTTVVASPHLLGYDLIVALPALLYLLDRHDVRRVRLWLVVLVALSWSSLPRHRWAGGASWPWVAVAASWCTVPLLVLWSVLWNDCRELAEHRSEPAEVAGSVAAG